MKLPIFILADYASKDGATKKLNILGVFDRVFTKQFPIKHRRFVIVAKIKAELGESTEPKELSVEIANDDGEKLIELKTSFQISFDQNGERPDHDFLWEINQLEFPHEGYYQIAIRVDGEELGTTSIKLIKIQ